MCHRYSYKLHDIFQLNWKDGGPTRRQLETLYNLGQNEIVERYKATAMLHGFDLDKKGTGGEMVACSTAQSPTSMFKDSKEYEHLPIDERQKLTDKMMHIHRSRFGESVKGMGVKDGR